jgi:hypothetical protein
MEWQADPSQARTARLDRPVGTGSRHDGRTPLQEI